MSPRSTTTLVRRNAAPVAAALAVALVAAACDSAPPAAAIEPAMSTPTVTATLVVEDVDRSIEFYRLLGLDIPQESIFVQDGVSVHVTVNVADGFDLDLDAVEVTRMWDPGWEQAPTGASGILNFHLEQATEVDAMFATLTGAGHDAHLAPFDAFWGARYAVVEDPDGNLVGLMGPDA